MLRPGTLTPGSEVITEAILVSKDVTNVRSVTMQMTGTIGTGTSDSMALSQFIFYSQVWSCGSFVLPIGETRLSAMFQLPPDGLPTYEGNIAAIRYVLEVYVEIPWWLDRHAEFTIPVVFPPAPAPEPVPKTFVTSRSGPRGNHPFIEVSLDATQIAAGELIAGSVSVQNLHDKTVEKVDVAFVEMEELVFPIPVQAPARRFSLRVFRGPAGDGDAIPFTVRIPHIATPTFSNAHNAQRGQPNIRVTTHLEVCATLSRGGSRVLLNAPLLVTPRASAPRRLEGYVAPVGKQRQKLLWQHAAAKHGFVASEDDPRMTIQHGNVTIEINTEARDKASWLVANLGWASLGIGLTVTERKWRDVLDTASIKTTIDPVDARLTVHAREAAQAKPIVGILTHTLQFDDVSIDDKSARFAIRGTSHARERLDAFLALVISIADLLRPALESIPAPALFTEADVAAWEATAERLRGRLERGRMWIHGGQIGPTSVDIGTLWSDQGAHVGTRLRVAIDPPLDKPLTPEDPSISPNARELWREAMARVKTLTVAQGEIVADLEQRCADPHALMPTLEVLVSLRRALSGSLATGAYR